MRFELNLLRLCSRAFGSIVVVFTLVGCAGPRSSTSAATPAPIGAALESWSDEIAQFEAADRANPPRAGGVLFVGSSTIRLWPDLKTDFPDADVVQRGFGGSQIDEVNHYASRIVLPYRPRLIVFYAGDNDIAAGKSPEIILQGYKTFVAVVRRALPATRIAFVSIKPSRNRWALVEKIRSANALVREYIAADPGLIYVDAFTPMLGKDGLPRPKLFLEDNLHMSRQGYALWRALLEPIVTQAAH